MTRARNIVWSVAITLVATLGAACALSTCRDRACET